MWRRSLGPVRLPPCVLLHGRVCLPPLLSLLRSPVPALICTCSPWRTCYWRSKLPPTGSFTARWIAYWSDPRALHSKWQHQKSTKKLRLGRALSKECIHASRGLHPPSPMRHALTRCTPLKGRDPTSTFWVFLGVGNCYAVTHCCAHVCNGCTPLKGRDPTSTFWVFLGADSCYAVLRSGVLP